MRLGYLLEARLGRLVALAAPSLLAVKGVGTDVAGALLTAAKLDVAAKRTARARQTVGTLIDLKVAASAATFPSDKRIRTLGLAESARERTTRAETGESTWDSAGMLWSIGV